MKATGIVRKVDELGRIVVPIELRRSLGIGDRDAVEMFLDENNIIIRKHQPSCVFCGSTNDTVEFKQKIVCKNCIDTMV
ncbi:MAG: AbrB/MazE/SpoVT family DNA-binding domain-containing protein [Clostridia bacterium]|nr:AbrB/MazE/SpoVT family DNA-binding domain-containing protein [Clostridia bacterium]